MKKLNQSGRSMIELLAVLALIGVFSVLGIVAFKEGMNSVRAKYILEQVQLRVNEATFVAELSKGHRKQVYTPEYINKTEEGAYGYSFETKDITMDRNSLAYYLSTDRSAATIEVVVTGKITPGVCQKLKGKMVVSGEVKKVNGNDLSKFNCGSEMTSLTLRVSKNKKED